MNIYTPGVLSRPTLRQALLQRRNSLNLIRLSLAVLVIISHAPYLCLGVEAVNQIPILNHSHQLGNYAVNMFFCISGFLIAHSARRGSVLGYLRRRILRIFPAYWTSILFVIFVGAPFAAFIGASGPFSWEGALEYAGANFDLFFLQYSLFDGPVGPYSGSWNGSAWTLSYEFLGYLLLIPLFYIRALRRNAALVVPGMYLLSLLPFFIFTVLDVNNNTLWEVARLYPMFFAGTLLYVYGDRISINPYLGVLCCIISFIAQFSAPAVVVQLGQLGYAYGILTLGVVIKTSLCHQNDISYGMYIYAWPVQVILILAGSASLGWFTNAALTIVCTLPLAWLSWMLIEKPAMNLKERGLGLKLSGTMHSSPSPSMIAVAARQKR